MALYSQPVSACCYGARIGEYPSEQSGAWRKEKRRININVIYQAKKKKMPQNFSIQVFKCDDLRVFLGFVLCAQKKQNI